MRQQTTSYILMVRPAHFAFNEETATTNAFQSRDNTLTSNEIQERALKEFDAMVDQLRAAGVQVIVAYDSPKPTKPDAVFPNNWITFHQEGFIVTYPMFAPNRRLERNDAILDRVFELEFRSDKRICLEVHEAEDRFLEGTGSIIFDHQNRLAYACLSPRTDEGLLEELCQSLDYQKVAFHSTDPYGQDIYHTNVMMALGETFVVICLSTIRDRVEREMVEAHFEKTGKEIIEISLAQMNSFAGNMLQVRNRDGQTILVMSSHAYQSLSGVQICRLEHHTPILHAPIHTIETYGGGSARCMMAEVFLPKV